MNALHAGVIMKRLLLDSSANQRIKNRIYSIVAPTGTPAPYVTYQRVSTTPSGSKDRYSEEDSASVVVSVFTMKYEDSVSLADEIAVSLSQERTIIEGIEIDEIRLTGASEDMQEDTYIQYLTFNIDFNNNWYDKSKRTGPYGL